MRLVFRTLYSSASSTWILQMSLFLLGPLVFFLGAPGTGSVKRLEAVLIVIDTKPLVSAPSQIPNWLRICGCAGKNPDPQRPLPSAHRAQETGQHQTPQNTFRWTHIHCPMGPQLLWGHKGKLNNFHQVILMLWLIYAYVYLIYPLTTNPFELNFGKKKNKQIKNIHDGEAKKQAAFSAPASPVL